MRVFAVFFAFFLGASGALAESDLSATYEPASGSTKIKSKAKANTPAAQTAAKTKRKLATKAARTARPSEITGTVSAGDNLAQPVLRNSYAAIPLAERAAIQADLVFTGDFNGPIDGEVTDRLVEAVKAFQRRHNHKATGALSPDQRAALAAAAAPRQQEVGFRLLDDPKTGARVGIPDKLATQTIPHQSGTHWRSAQGQLQIETFRIDTGATLEAVFEQQKALPRRRVTSGVLRPDHFVVSGTQGLKKFHVRAFAKDGEVRGITILYDQAMAGMMDPVAAAMASAFLPFASHTVAGSAAAPRRKVEYGTGLVVSTVGHILTARDMTDGCQVIVIPSLGNAERLADDKNSELALLRVYGARGLTAVGLAGAAPTGDKIALVGIADPQAQGGGASITAFAARRNEGPKSWTLETSPALGFSGAAALDSEGRVFGMAVLNSSVVAGPASSPRATLVPLETIRTFLEAHDVTPAAARPGIEEVKASVVRVICVRR
jgi:peptidoglycan hydrolase-like protein with peptidoglycan-binding domain